MFSLKKPIRKAVVASLLGFGILTVGSLPGQDNSIMTVPAAAPDSKGTANNNGRGIDLHWPVPAKTDANTGRSTGEPTLDDAGRNTAGANSELVKNVAHNKLSINLVWTLIAGFLVMFMQAGFALLETGLCRAKNAAHVMSMNFLVYALAVLGFWFCGFAIMFGGYSNGPAPIGWQPALGQGLNLLNKEITIQIFGRPFGICGGTGFILGKSVLDTAILALFLFQVVFMDTSATIPTGAMAERWNFKNFLIYGFWVGMFPYALFGNWVWGGGWLAQLGMNFGLGHGHVDFAGSSVVHQTGGAMALSGAWLLGARLGKFGSNRRPRPIQGHNIPMVILGTFVLAFGWFGFNSGSTLAGTDSHIAMIAVNTMLASAAGAVLAAFTMIWRFGRPDPSMMCNGMLAGLVAVTAPCAFVSPAGAVIIGAAAGMLVVWAIIFVERVLRIDDPVGAISVHGVCGAFGVLSVGLFANGSYGAGWGGVHKLLKDGAIQVITNDATKVALEKYAKLISDGWVDQGVTGGLGRLFGGAYNDWSQLGAQLIGSSTNFVFVGLFSLIWFRLSNALVPLRSKRDDEFVGLDIPELGAEAYPDYRVTDKSSPGVR
ncbi:MAG: ammonium transporter [Chthoniobacterales bacterium]